MSDKTEDDGDITVKIHLYPTNGGTGALRQIGLGIKPLVLLEMEEGETEDDLVFSFTGSLIDSHDELIELLEGSLTVLKDAVEQYAGDKNADE